MAYTKTKWTETTPITVDNMNKIETGIANALDATTGGTVKGKLTVKGDIQLDSGNLYSNKNGWNKPVIEVFDGNEKGNAVAYGAGGLTVLAGGESGSLVVQNITNAEENAVVSADNGVKLYANLQNGWDSKKTVELTAGGRFKLHNNYIEFSPDNSGYARMGIDGATQDIFISNINNSWFRLKGDKTITYAGNKVYTSFDKPKAAEIGALPLKGGTMTGSITLPNSVAGQIQQTLSDGTITSTLYITAGNILKIGSADVPNVCIHSKNNPQVSVNGSTYTLYHTGKKPTAADVGALPLTGGTLTGDTTFNKLIKLNAWPNYGTGTADFWYDANNKTIKVENATNLTLNGTSVSKEGHTHNYLPLTGGTISGAVVLDNNMGIGSKDTSGNVKWLAWVDKSNKTQLGDGTLKSVINSNANPEVNISGKGYTLYHTGNKPTAADIGAAPASHTHNYLPLTGGTVSGETVFTNYLSVKAWSGYGTGTAQMWYDGNTKLLNIQNAEGLNAGSHRVATWEGSNPTHHMFRYGSGLGGANGYITFSY